MLIIGGSNDVYENETKHALVALKSPLLSNLKTSYAVTILPLRFDQSKDFCIKSEEI